MAYSNVSQGIGSGRAAGGESNRDLAIKVFSGEVLTAFETANIFLGKVQNRTIKSGKSASFAVIGKYAAAVDTHVPGTDITPNLINAGERVIEIDDLKYASVFVDNFEEAMQHYETRSQYSTEMGRRLSKTVDLAVIAQLDACVAAAANAGDNNGAEGQPAAQTAITVGTAAGATPGAKGDSIIAALFDAQTAMDEDDIPGDRNVVMSPKNYNRLVQSGAVHKDMTSGNGGIDSGKVTQIAGHNIMVSNNISSSDIYMFTQNAVGVVKLLDVKSEVNYIPEKLGDLMTSSYAMGFGVLNNGCVVKMTTDD
jgi:hypothetical protein